MLWPSPIIIKRHYISSIAIEIEGNNMVNRPAFDAGRLVVVLCNESGSGWRDFITKLDDVFLMF